MVSGTETASLGKIYDGYVHRLIRDTIFLCGNLAALYNVGAYYITNFTSLIISMGLWLVHVTRTHAFSALFNP